ncbi:hypothetical protein [Rhizobium sp. NPDC090279]|uniref:hypothetical protein n=1 Tax=Rhizobium sp. NPDC090279 TaxID=3364499 RepID=UPI003839E330
MANSWMIFPVAAMSVGRSQSPSGGPRAFAEAALCGWVLRDWLDRQIGAGNISAGTHDNDALTDNPPCKPTVENQIPVIDDIAAYLAGNHGVSPGFDHQSTEQASRGHQLSTWLDMGNSGDGVADNHNLGHDQITNMLAHVGYALDVSNR